MSRLGFILEYMKVARRKKFNRHFIPLEFFSNVFMSAYVWSTVAVSKISHIAAMLPLLKETLYI